MYIENYKNLINKIKEELNKSKGTPFFTDRKTQYCAGASSPQHDLPIQCDPNQYPGKGFMGPTN